LFYFYKNEIRKGRCKMTSRKGVSELLVNFLYNLNYNDLPSEVIDQAKKCLLDYLGVVLAGSATETAKKMQAFLSRFNDEKNITAIGYRRKTDIFKASLVNGITSHALELDEGHRRSTVHSSAAVISTLLPLVEQENIDGMKAIAAIVAGYETTIRIGRAIQPSHRNRGFHATATCGTFGAAMTASKVLNLTEKEMSCALGIAGTSASGLQQYLEDGSEIKQYHPGKAALCGILAAYLAQSGVTAPNNILEGKLAFFQSASDNYNISEITNNLGDKYSILEVYFKPYAACRHCHAPIEAVINIRSKKNIEVDNVEKINVLTYKSAVDGHTNPYPQSEVGAKMSLPFSVAVALKTGRASPKEFTPVFFNNLEVLNLAKIVEAQEEPELSHLYPDKRPAIVEIVTKDGNKFRERVDFPKGEPENPLSDKEIIKKFTDLASCCRSKEEISKIMEIVENSEEKIGKIFQFLV
jgi:2-methylcitrate dehydratase PrpD